MQTNKIANWQVEVAGAGSKSTARLEQIKRLLFHLGVDLVPDGHRFAPSIITRSEASLFGVSTPRFSVRLYLKESAGFINCRRIDALVNSCNWKTPRSSENDDRKDDIESLITVLDGEYQPVVADAYFSPKCFYSTPIGLFQHIGNLSGSHLGESQYSDPILVPYVKFLNLGGGLCAQACCFMATLLLRRYADHVCGLLEISHFASYNPAVGFGLSGLKIESMQKYFHHVNLRTYWQVQPKTTAPYRLKLDWIPIACRAYLKSGMPVILATTIGQLCKGDPQSRDPRSVYQKNRIKIVKLHQETSADWHNLIVVGWTQSSVIVNDPATVPFLKIENDELISIARPPDESSANPEALPCVLPVTPMQVMVPLLDEIVSTEEVIPGIYSISHAFRTMKMVVDGFDSANPHLVPEPFQLINFSEDIPESAVQNFATEETGAKKVAEYVVDVIGTVVARRNWPNRHWFWIETYTDVIVIWDAESIQRFGRPFIGPVASIKRSNLGIEFQIL